MSFKQVITDTNIFYAITNTGELLWYRDLKRDGTNGAQAETGWDSHSGSQIGVGWDGFSHVFSGGDGIIYAIKPTGELLWYRDLKRDGTNGAQAETGWDSHSGSQIGVGWDGFSHVFSDGGGIIYAIKPTGELLWYRDVKRDGTNGAHAETGWDSRSGSQIGVGWDEFSHVFAGGDGIIYAIKPTGELLWYRDLKRDGSNGAHAETGWDSRSGSQIGTGWNGFTHVSSGGDGIIYAIVVDGFLLYYRDLARNGTSNWAFNGVGQAIGTGWFILQRQKNPVEGYCVPLSAAPGETIEFKLSAQAAYNVTYLRLKRQEDGSVGIPMMDTFSREAGTQEIPQAVWQNGCAWETSFTLAVPEHWPSSIYAARCVSAEGTETYMVFVVKPTRSQRGDIAVLANTNTWNAYNDWGGRSKYSSPPGATLSFERPNPATSPADDGQLNHLTRAELWVLKWLEDAGYHVDVYTDQDFHTGIDGFDAYKVLVLSTHPEYWTLAMLDNLEHYLSQGGHVLYLGGNGLFERVDYNAAENVLIALNGDPSSDRSRSYFRNLTPPRPERSILGVAYRYDNYMTFAPLKVLMADHPFFAGTGLNNGDEIGLLGLNNAASGWEMDTSEPGNAPDGVIVSATGSDDRGSAPANIQLLARGTNPGYGADMTYYETAGGGFVFAIGSISVGGSLVQDDHLQTIIKNVIQKSLGG